MTDDSPDVLSEPGRRTPLIAAVVVVVIIAVVSWAISSHQPAAEQLRPSSPPESPYIYPVGPSYASTGPTLAPAAQPCPGPTASASPSPVAAAGGRVREGRLSYATDPSFRPPVRANYPAFATDVTLQSREVFSDSDLRTPGWTAVLALGRLRREAGFDQAGHGLAERVLSCLLAQYVKQGRDPEARLTSGAMPSSATTVAGDRVQADVVLSSDSGFPGEHVWIVVIPDGEDWSMFLVSIPIGSVELSSTAERALASLRIDR